MAEILPSTGLPHLGQLHSRPSGTEVLLPKPEWLPLLTSPRVPLRVFWNSLPVSTPHCLPREGDQGTSRNNNKTCKWINFSYEKITHPTTPQPQPRDAWNQQAGDRKTTLNIRVLQLPNFYAYQATTAGPAAHRGGHGADGADGRAAGAVGQGRDTHSHTFGLLGLGWTGRREANSDDLVDGCKETELGWALEIPGEHERARVMPSFLGVSPASDSSSVPQKIQASP